MPPNLVTWFQSCQNPLNFFKFSLDLHTHVISSWLFFPLFLSFYVPVYLSLYLSVVYTHSKYDFIIREKMRFYCLYIFPERYYHSHLSSSFFFLFPSHTQWGGALDNNWVVWAYKGYPWHSIIYLVCGQFKLQWIL